MPSSARLAILISQYPAINHAVILREIRCLRESLDIATLSISAPDRPAERFSTEEREEAARTIYIKPQGLLGAIRAHFITLFRRPIAWLRGWLYVVRLAGAHPLRLPRLIAYFTEALMVGVWIERNGIGHLHTHYSSTVALLCRQVFPIDISISFHGPDEFNDTAGFWVREKIEASRFVRAISYYARSQLMRTCGFEHWDKIHVVYMGVDPDVFSPRLFRAASETLEILCVGRLAPVKAQHILLAVMRQLVCESEAVQLHLAGGGPDLESIRAAVTRDGLEHHVIVHGFTPQEKLDQLYRETDVFALASFAEGVPGVLMEAMAMEIPCVATGITGVPELIENGVHGLLVPPSDVEGFAAAIRRLIHDSELRLRLGRQGRQRVLDRFHLPNNARSLAEIFRRYLQ